MGYTWRLSRIYKIKRFFSYLYLVQDPSSVSMDWMTQIGHDDDVEWDDEQIPLFYMYKHKFYM